jgi:hypothetical protein
MVESFLKTLKPFCMQFLKAWKKREDIEDHLLKRGSFKDHPRDPTMEDPELFLANARVLFSQLI